MHDLSSLGPEAFICDSSKSILIVAPLGQDGKLAASVLKNAGLQVEVIKSPAMLLERLRHPASVLVIAEEALTPQVFEGLNTFLQNQPPWSDLPLILLTSPKGQLKDTQQILDRFSVSGNISLLERPFRTMTLVSATKVAVRSRERQYQVRDLIAAQISAVRQRDEFLSIASHELNTPITSLKLHVQMRQRFLKRGDQSVYEPEKIDQMLLQTGHQVERLGRLVDDMLDVTRLENGKMQLHRTVCDLKEIAEGVYHTLTDQFRVAGSVIEFNAGESVTGNWDRYRIEQVVTNLFTNALKYGKGRTVSIEVKNVGTLGVLEIKDHGVGIKAEDQVRIFDRFERVGSNSHVGGLGLGLFITRQIVELHGGKIELKSEFGKGSTFTVSLPLYDSAEFTP